MKEFPISHRQSRAIHIADVHRSARSAAARGTPHVESPKSTQIFFFDGKELPTPPLLLTQKNLVKKISTNFPSTSRNCFQGDKIRVLAN